MKTMRAALNKLAALTPLWLRSRALPEWFERQDVDCTKEIQAALAQRDLLPPRHFVDAGYVDSQLLVESREKHGIELFGPTRYNQS